MNTLILDSLTLKSGGHRARNDGVCLLEAVAWFAGEVHSDHPECTSPVLGTYGRSLNDSLPQAKRQKLIPFVPRMVGTDPFEAGDMIPDRFAGGHARCSCGAESEHLPSQGARRRWHAAHKQEVTR